MFYLIRAQQIPVYSVSALNKRLFKRLLSVYFAEGKKSAYVLLSRLR